MGKYKINLTEKAVNDISQYLKHGDKASFSKVQVLLNELAEHPEIGTGKPEELKYSLKGYWSRRINKKDRLIYTINEEVITVVVVSASGHYQ